MSRNYDQYESEFATAIAAAAFAIHSSVEEEISSEHQKKKPRDGIQTPMISLRVKIRKEEEPFMQPADQYNRVSRRFSGNEAKDAVESSMRKRMEQESRSASRSSIQGHVGADESQRGTFTRRRSLEAKDDAWEKSAMAKIRKRHGKMESSIVAWENEKKMKAKLEMERKKRELELRGALNQEHYQNKITRIDHIGGGARVQMEEKRRNEESKVKERKKRIKSKATVPFRCFCF